MLGQGESIERAEFLANYAALLARLAAGERLPEPPTTARLTHDKPTVITASGDARLHLAAMRRLLTGQSPVEETPA